MMTDLDRIRLYDQAIAWIFEHCSDMTAFVYALDTIGLSRNQAIEELKDCWYGEPEDGEEQREQAIKEVYGEE